MRESDATIKEMPLPEYSTSSTEVVLIKIIVPKSKVAFYGCLSKPRKEGKYPVLLYLPGAAIAPTKPLVNFISDEIITFSLEIHGINPQMDGAAYDEVKTAFNDYPYIGIDSRDTYYFKHVILGCIKASDFLCALPSFDGSNFAVFGGSQGGFLSMATASLDKRVSCLVAFHPAMSDVTGDLFGRAGGWPQFFNSKFQGIYNMPNVIKAISYFDTVNFAKRIHVPGFYSFGYNDHTCPPTANFAVINSIESSKTLFLTPVTGHWRITEMMSKSAKWVKRQFKLVQ